MTSTIPLTIIFSKPRVGTCALVKTWMCRNEGRGYLNWGFLIKYGMYGHFSCVTQQSADLKAETQKLFTRGSEFATCSLLSATFEAALWVFRLHYCDCIIISTQLMFCPESWSLLLHFYFLSPLVHKCAFFFLKGLGKWISLLLFIKLYGQERIYQKCKVGGGGRSN